MSHEMNDFEYVVNPGLKTEATYTKMVYTADESPPLIVAATTEGLKYDEHKPRTDLLPTQALEGVAAVLGFGAKKHDTWNWAKGMAYGRLIGAALRRIFAFAPAATTEGLKYDEHKPRTDLLPTQALEGVAAVLGFGAKKYDTWNWAKGMAYGRLIGAALRHIFAFARGEDNDKETGLSHLDHAACCILFLSTYVKTKRGTDDRFRF